MKEKEQALYDIASTQGGLFTAAEAVKAGYSRKNFAYHLKKNSWERLGRGIYRISRFPESKYERFLYWYLWSRDRKGEPQGVISHESVLEIFELTDLMPKRIHLTVPTTFARTARPPKTVQIHKANFKNEDCEEVDGFKVTKVLRTIMDLIEEKEVSEEFIEQAVKEAKRRGFLTQMDFRNNPILGKYIA